MKKLSVIVPIYNVERYLKRCVDSILGQTYSNLEVILVDDGSTDGCGAICDAYKEKDKRVYVIHKKNGGLSDARNAGIRIATGEYIAFVDSDDYIDSNMYKKMIERLELTGANIAICDFEYVAENGNSILEKNNEKKIIEEVLTVDEMWRKLCSPNNSCYVTAWNKIYKRSIFDKINYPKGKIHEDEFIIHDIYAKVKTIVCLDKAFYKYVQRSDSIVNEKYNLNRFDIVEAYLNRTNFFVQRRSLENAEYSFWLAMDAFIIGMGKISNKDENYYRRIRELQKKCKYVYKDIPKKYFKVRKGIKKIVVFFFPLILEKGYISKLLMSFLYMQDW